MVILWIIFVIFYEKILQKYYRNFFSLKKENFFRRKLINDNINFEMLVKIREQSEKLLPYKDKILKNSSKLQQHIQQLVNQINNIKTYPD